MPLIEKCTKRNRAKSIEKTTIINGVKESKKSWVIWYVAKMLNEKDKSRKKILSFIEIFLLKFCKVRSNTAVEKLKAKKIE